MRLFKFKYRKMLLVRKKTKTADRTSTQPKQVKVDQFTTHICLGIRAFLHEFFKKSQNYFR